MKKIQSTIENAEAILVFAGAGMSADSNLTTYQDKEGFFTEYPLYKELKKSYVSMMSYNGVLDDPHFAWGYFAHQYGLYRDAVPHEGYSALLKLCQSKDDYFVVTTNVDGLFIKAGFPTQNVHEVHGSIHTLQCSVPCSKNTWHTKGLDVDIDYATMRALDSLPACPKCGHVARPNICMYGDTDESYIWEKSQKNADNFRAWRSDNKSKKLVIFEIGVGAEGLKRHMKQYEKEFFDVTLIRVNPVLHQENGIVHLAQGVKEAFVNLGKIATENN